MVKNERIIYLDETERHIVDFLIDFIVEVKEPFNVTDYMLNEFRDFLLNDLRLSYDINDTSISLPKIYKVLHHIMLVMEDKEEYEMSHVIKRLKESFDEIEEMD
jgi:hypothetical protein